MFHQVEEKAKAKLKEASKQELAKAKDELKAKIPTKERRAKIVREFTDIDKIKVALPLGVAFVRDSAAVWQAPCADRDTCAHPLPLAERSAVLW
jgi:hypothetical protein